MTRRSWPLAAALLLVATSGACGRGGETATVQSEREPATTTSPSTSAAAPAEPGPTSTSAAAPAPVAPSTTKRPTTTAPAPGGAGPTTTAAPPATTASPAPTTTTAPSPPAQGTSQITIQNFTFSPPVLQVAVGATVVATNKDSAPHSWTADDGSWDSGTLSRDGSFSHRFTAPGTFPYHCAIHPSMKGSVTVG